MLSTAHPAQIKASVVEAKSRFSPYPISAEVDPISDPGGSGNVFQHEVLIDGYAKPFSTIWLAVGTKPGYFTNVSASDATGHYVIEVPLGYGNSHLQVFAEAPSESYSNVATVDVSRGDEIVAWDAIALRAFLNQGTSPDEAARILAILHAAQYDAVADIKSPNSAYQVHLTPTKGASAEAAADSSAYTVLSGFFPTLKPTFLNAYAAAVAGLPTTGSTTSGLDFGFQVGVQTLINRDNDGSNTAFALMPSSLDGKWRPTPPAFSPAVDPQFGLVTPFEITSGAEFRPAAPPSVGSTAYDLALSQVATLGRSFNSTRTSAQTSAALFWGDPVGSLHSPGPWNLFADQLSAAHKDSLVQDARLFAQLDFALADSAIASSDSQVTYDEWRPVSAIRKSDPTFTPLIATPASPSYVSESAAFGTAASGVLSAAFGSKAKFTANVDVPNGQSRTFPSFAAAAAEVANSRVWAGDNFAFDAQAGATLGAQVAQAVAAKFPKGK